MSKLFNIRTNEGLVEFLTWALSDFNLTKTANESQVKEGLDALQTLIAEWDENIGSLDEEGMAEMIDWAAVGFAAELEDVLRSKWCRGSADAWDGREVKWVPGDNAIWCFCIQ
jgi:hypothetical protein